MYRLRQARFEKYTDWKDKSHEGDNFLIKRIERTVRFSNAMRAASLKTMAMSSSIKQNRIAETRTNKEPMETFPGQGRPSRF